MAPNFVKTVLISSINILSVLTFIDIVKADPQTSVIVDGYNYTYVVHCEDKDMRISDMTNGCGAMENFAPGTVRSMEANIAIAKLTDEGILTGGFLRPDVIDLKVAFWYCWMADLAHNASSPDTPYQVISLSIYDRKLNYTCLDKFCNFSVTDLRRGMCEHRYLYNTFMIAPKSLASDRHWIRVATDDTQPSCDSSPQANCYLCQKVEPIKSTTPTTTTTKLTSTTTKPTSTTTKPTSTTTTTKPESTTTATKLTSTSINESTTTVTNLTTTSINESTTTKPASSAPVPTSPAPKPVSLSPAPVAGAFHNILSGLLLTAIVITTTLTF